jgi:hypothetical protein
LGIDLTARRGTLPQETDSGTCSRCWGGRSPI